MSTAPEARAPTLGQDVGHEPAAGGQPGFRLVGERTIHEGHLQRVVTATFLDPMGETFERDVIRSPGAVAVVPLDDEAVGPNVIMVNQYRPALDSWLLEIPAGVRDRRGEAPEETAARELAEEAGLAATSYELLTTMINAAGSSDQRTHIFLARGLSEVPSKADGVEERYLEVRRIPLATLLAMVRAGEVIDAKSIVGLLLAWGRLA